MDTCVWPGDPVLEELGRVVSRRKDTRGHCWLFFLMVAHECHPFVTSRNKAFGPKTTVAGAGISSKSILVYLGKLLNLKARRKLRISFCM